MREHLSTWTVFACLHNQQLGLAGWGFNPGWWQVPRFALGVAIYDFHMLRGLGLEPPGRSVLECVRV